MGSAVT